MAFRVPEHYRISQHSSSLDGNNGAFMIPGRTPKDQLFVIASDGAGWEHVSVSKRYSCPTWDEMCVIKALFWDDPEDYAIQFHPPRSEYVNNHPYCLHLWRPVDQPVPLPGAHLVGIKGRLKPTVLGQRPPEDML